MQVCAISKFKVGCFLVLLGCIWGSPLGVSPAYAAGANTKNVKSRGQKVSLFGYSLQLQTILNQLSRNQGLNLIIRNDVKANVNIDVPTLKEVDLEDALRVVLMPLGYSYRIEGNDLVIFARAFERFRVSMPMVKAIPVPSGLMKPPPVGIGRLTGL